MHRMFMRLFVVCVVALMSVGCTSEVPAGFKGQIQTASGWAKELLPPGRATCWGRDVLWLVETRDLTQEENLHILLKEEKVNFDVKFAFTFTVKDDPKDALPLFDKVRPDKAESDSRIITLEGIYRTYAQPVLLSVPMQMIKVYTTETIMAEGTRIEQEIQTAVVKALEQTPVRVKRLAMTNMDFPPFITKAQEAAKQQEIEIRTEENRQKKRLIEEENKRKIAEISYQTEMLEAKRIADSNRVIGESLTGPVGAAYLRWHEIKVYGAAAAGPNNCIFLPMNLLAPQAGSGGGLGYEAAMTPVRQVLQSAINKTSGAPANVEVPKETSVEKPKEAATEKKK